jgi:hypothetical protein
LDAALRLCGSIRDVLRGPSPIRQRWSKNFKIVVQQWEYRTPVHFHEVSPDWERISGTGMPGRPDERRFNKRGLFAVILKDVPFR